MKQQFIKLRCSLLVALTHSVALPALRFFRKTAVFPYTIEQLQNLPAGSLGNDLAAFIKQKNLSLLSHYARHDLKHIVLGYDTTEEGELCLQSFMLGNGRISFPVLATVAFGICTAPEFWKKMWLSYNMGKSCNSIHNWNWYSLLLTPTVQLQEQVYKK